MFCSTERRLCSGRDDSGFSASSALASSPPRVHLERMDLQQGQGRVWEGIVELARVIDHCVASRQGIDTAEVLRLSQAVIAFQRRLAAGAVLTPEVDPAGSAEG
jgi:hypothetical protein